MGTLKLQSGGPLYSNTVIGTVDVNGFRQNLLRGIGAPKGGKSTFSLFKPTANTTARCQLTAREMIMSTHWAIL